MIENHLIYWDMDALCPKDYLTHSLNSLFYLRVKHISIMPESLGLSAFFPLKSN